MKEQTQMAYTNSGLEDDLGAGTFTNVTSFQTGKLN